MELFFSKNPTDDWYATLELLRDKQELLFRIITHCLPLEKLETGLQIMRDKTGVWEDLDREIRGI